MMDGGIYEHNGQAIYGSGRGVPALDQSGDAQRQVQHAHNGAMSESDEEMKRRFPLYSMDVPGRVIRLFPGVGAEERIAELEGALRPFAKAWAERHQIYEGQAVEVNIDPEWVRYAAEVMVLDRHSDPPPVKSMAERRRDWESCLYNAAQQARCDECGVPLDGAAKHEDGCGWPGRQAEMMRPASEEMMARLNAGAANAYTFPDHGVAPQSALHFKCSDCDPRRSWISLFWERIRRRNGR